MSNGPNKKRVGLISFRIAGTDGVSLETLKWVEVLKDLGWESFFLAGELDTDEGRSMLDPVLQFKHPDIQETYDAAFNNGYYRNREVTQRLHSLCKSIKNRIYEFVDKFDLCMLIAENILTIPLNLPLAMALTEYLVETGMKCIAHHHDFVWERKRFLINCVPDILYAHYPPNLNNIAHCVINSQAQLELAFRTGISSTVIPNVMNFDSKPQLFDDYNRDFRAALGIEKDEVLFLQPTRLVQRKGIEHAIELIARIKEVDKSIRPVLLISHASGDEGFEYERRVREYAKMLNIRAIFESRLIDDARTTDDNGNKVYDLSDAYAHCDIVTYPSIYEGFGNAFLEAVYYNKPIVVNNYSIYAQDIKPLGFQVIEFDNFISQKTVADIVDVLHDTERIATMTRKNFEIASQYFSFGVLKARLLYLINKLWGTTFE